MIEIPKLALLGIIPDGVLPEEMHTMWTRSLYLACKHIFKKWTSPIPPTHKQWCEKLNYILKREKLMYKHRGTPKILKKYGPIG